MQVDQHRLHAQQEAASAAAAAAAEATRKAGERRHRADEEVVAIRAMEEQSRTWQRARVADAALQEREDALSSSLQQLQAREDALV